ncbi:Aspartate-semialdehyde dehydrogenase [Serratia fonticola]|uniref:Aspartate-semialdehyde dehydrogenase n=1 Tax=Serratia fonticola TaxID=47917 RepID=A0A4U9TMW8_SERFO|nr:Aspartate-semialdehyde dehydrogenase [Serratia fonticola]
MKNVGFIGWRGMVGSVLMQRMTEERDFDAIRPGILLHFTARCCRPGFRVASSKVRCKMRMMSKH